jgi:hypothetical protein
LLSYFIANRLRIGDSHHVVFFVASLPEIPVDNESSSAQPSAGAGQEKDGLSILGGVARGSDSSFDSNLDQRRWWRLGQARQLGRQPCAHGYTKTGNSETDWSLNTNKNSGTVNVQAGVDLAPGRRLPISSYELSSTRPE